MGLSVSHLKVASFLLVFGSVLPAQAEVTNCKEITALPAIVNTSGTWCLKKNLASGATTGNAIDVQVGAVTIDLNGFTLTGSVAATTQAVGIHNLNRTNVTIRNGTIRGFRLGVSLEGPGSSNNVVEDMHLDLAQEVGVRARQTVRAVIRNNRVTNTGGGVTIANFGISAEGGASATIISNNIVDGVRANNGGGGIIADASDLTEIRDNSVLNVLSGDGINNNGVGIESNGATNTTIQNNRVLDGATLGSTGILANGTGNNCISNVIHRFTTPISGCPFSSGNLTPPST